MTEPKTKPARHAKSAPQPARQAPRQKRALRSQVSAAPTAEGASTLAEGSPAWKGPAGKLGVVVALMRRPEGATVAQMGEATGWQPHSVRGALAGSLKRKHELTIVGEPGEAGRVYRIAAEPPA